MMVGENLLVNRGKILQNSNRAMHLLVVATRDKRKRHQFLVRPLQLVKDVCVHVFEPKEDDTLVSYIVCCIRFAFRYRSKLNWVIMTGGDYVALLWFILNKTVIRGKFVCRLGGNKLEIMEKNIASSPSLLARLRMFIKYLIVKFVLNHSTFLVVVNEYLAKEIHKLLKVYIPIYIIPQPILHERKAHLRKKENDRLKILSVTNLSYFEKLEGVKKIVEYTMFCFNLHSYEYLIEMKIVGGGKYLEDLKRFIDAMDIDSNRFQIYLTGFVDDPSEFYRESDIFVYCSTLDGLPNSILEAQNYGLPLLINRYEPFCVFKERQNALFFDISDPVDFVYKLNLLIRDNRLRERMGKNNTSYIDDSYTPNVIALLWNDLMEKEENRIMERDN